MNWSCGTISMCTTLHLLIGNRQPHTLPNLYIPRARILSLHKALLAWLITGTPPALWAGDCLHGDITPPAAAHTGPYERISVAAMIASPKGAHWRPIHPTPTTEDRPDRADLPVRPTRVQSAQRRTSDLSSDTLPATTSNPQPDNTVPRLRNPQPRAPNSGGPTSPQVLKHEDIRTRHHKATTRHVVNAQLHKHKQGKVTQASVQCWAI